MRWHKMIVLVALGWLVGAEVDGVAWGQVYGSAISQGLRSWSVNAPRGSSTLGSFRRYSTGISGDQFQLPTRNPMYVNNRAAPSLRPRMTVGGQLRASASLPRAGSGTLRSWGGMSRVNNSLGGNGALGLLASSQSAGTALGRPQYSRGARVSWPVRRRRLPISYYDTGRARAGSWPGRGRSDVMGSQSLAGARSIIDAKALGTDRDVFGPGGTLGRRTLAHRAGMGPVGMRGQGYGGLLTDRSSRFVPR